MKDDFDYGSHDCCGSVTRQSHLTLVPKKAPPPNHEPRPAAEATKLRAVPPDDKPKAEV